MQPAHLPNFHITEANYYQLTGPGFWEVNEVPVERQAQCGGPFDKDITLAVFASGVAPHITGVAPEGILGGIDWIRFEPNPKGSEPSLNVNHFIIGLPDGIGLPVWGPYRDGSIVPHWPQDDDINRYYER